MLINGFCSRERSSLRCLLRLEHNGLYPDHKSWNVLQEAPEFFISANNLSRNS